eukprot:s312_g22.t2
MFHAVGDRAMTPEAQKDPQPLQRPVGAFVSLLESSFDQPMAGGAAGRAPEHWEHNAKAQLRAILQELHENGDIQFNEAVFAPGKASLEIPGRSEVQVPSDNASATELRQSLLQLQEKHATLMNAAREEIEALRKALQEAHAELASAKAEATLRPCQVPPSKKKNVVTVSQLMHRWIGTASLRSMFQLWHKEAQLERLQRLHEDHQAELLDRNQELQAWRARMEQSEQSRPVQTPAPTKPGLVPLALLNSWRQSSKHQTLSHFWSLWREQSTEAQRHRQAFEVFELKSQLQEQDLSRASLRNAWSQSWRQKVVDACLAFRLRGHDRSQLRVTLFSWRATALVAATRRQRFLRHRWGQVTAVFHAWRLTTLRSLAQDLTRLVSEKLPCKPGAKLAMHHINRKLILDQTLTEQEIVGKSEMLSCTYMPTNLYTAWRYASQLPICEREFALEGVTQLEGAEPGEYLCHLPSSLQSLSFGRDFNQSVERVTLPSSLQSLSFGDKFNQSLELVTFRSSLQSLSFGRHFNQRLERVTLPSSLQSLSFGDMFRQSLERVTLPSSLQSLSFGDAFNQSLELVTLPSSLQSLSFGHDFNQRLERVTFPSSLQSLNFGYAFNQSLELVTLPSSLQSLSFGFLFNQSLERVTLPSSLQSLSFGFLFNQSLERVTLPSSLQSLSFGDKFSPSLVQVTFRSSLQSLSFGNMFNQSLERVTLPSSLQSLSFGYESLERVTLPSSLQSLSFGDKFNQSLELVTLPSSLQSLSFGSTFNQSLEQVTLPSSLQSLSFGDMFRQSLELVTFPSSLQSLNFGYAFNQRLERVTLPSSLQSLSFGNMFNQSLERVTLPSSLQSLSFGHDFNQSLERVTLPSSLQSLSFGDKFNQSLERVTLPSSLQSLSFGRDFNQSLERVTLPSSLQSFSALQLLPAAAGSGARHCCGGQGPSPARGEEVRLPGLVTGPAPRTAKSAA